MIWNNEELCRQYIQSCNIQGLFSTPVLGEICLHRFARGENIYREGEPLRELYFLVKGQVKVFRTHHNGKVSVVEFASAFDILGELELVNAGTRPSLCRPCGSATVSDSAWPAAVSSCCGLHLPHLRRTPPR